MYINNQNITTSGLFYYYLKVLQNIDKIRNYIFITIFSNFNIMTLFPTFTIKEAELNCDLILN